jgi:hypothetical protein
MECAVSDAELMPESLSLLLPESTVGVSRLCTPEHPGSTRAEQITAPNAGGPRQFSIRTPLAARVGQFWRCPASTLASRSATVQPDSMTQKEMALEAVRELPDDVTFREIADRIEFLAGIQIGLDQLDRKEGVSHEEVKRELASWLTA